nr:MAG TPA: hypothetical protein [Caudoviricetes sp.]
MPYTYPTQSTKHAYSAIIPYFRPYLPKRKAKNK